MGKFATITRRTFLVGSVAIVGGVLFGTYKYKKSLPNPLDAEHLPDTVTLNPYLKIDANGVTVITPRAEMGQGVHSMLAMLVAEELDLDWKTIRTEHGPASNSYYNSVLLEPIAPYPSYVQSGMATRLRKLTHIPAKFLGLQVTGGSTSAMDGFDKMRSAGASARLTLIMAAAQHWGVAEAALKTADGFVINESTNQKLSYSELAPAAAKISAPSAPPLRDPAQWRFLGKSMPRVDIPAKSTGTAQYAIDVRLPNMLYATVKMNPHFGAKMKRFDPTKALAMRGVEKVFGLESGFAVLATNTWRAFQAAEAVEVEWEAAAYPVNQAAIAAALDAGFAAKPNGKQIDRGDVEAALKGAKDIIEAEYRVPYLAHSTMEPMTAVAQVNEGQVNIWIGTQAPTKMRDVAAKIANVEKSHVHVHTVYMGGGFGRRGEADFGAQAVQIAMQSGGRPVKLTWTREEDIRHDFYRPAAVGRFRAAMGEKGPQAMDVQISSPSIFASQAKRGGRSVMGSDPMIAEGTAGQPDAIEHMRIRSYAPDLAIPVGYWRSVGVSFNGFLHECFLDELAASKRLDPIAMRLPMLGESPTAQKVVEAVAEMSGWATPLAQGRGRGFAYTLAFGAHTAQVVEVTQTPQGIKIDKVYCAMDVGKALDPRNLEAQVQGGIIFGLTAAMMGEITFKDGMVEQSNFHDYEVLRMRQCPQIVVKILENNPVLTGAGEPGTPPAAPALANAIFAATGVRVRALPLNRTVKFV